MTENKCTDITPLPAPFEVLLHPTNRCNSNCRFCWLRYHSPESRELPDEKWLEIADEICALGVPNVTFVGGGEPLLRARLVLQMMEKFSRAGIRGNLITNGMLITERLARRMVELRWESVQISIHASEQKLNDLIRGKEGASQLTIHGIENLNHWKRCLGSTLPLLKLRMVITNENFTDVPRFVRFAHFIAASQVTLRMGTDESPNAKKRILISDKNLPRLGKVIQQGKKIAEGLGVYLDFEFDPRPYEPEVPTNNRGENNKSIDARLLDVTGSKPKEHKKQKKEPYCFMPFTNLSIFSNGLMNPCCKFFGEQFNHQEVWGGFLEDVRSRSLKEAWAQGFRKLRSTMIANTGLVTNCRDCALDLQLERMQSHVNFWHQKFEYYKRNKKFKEGIAFGLQQIREQPNSKEFHKYLEELLEMFITAGKYNKGLRFGLEHLKQYPDNPTIIRYVEEFRTKLENQLRESAEQLAQSFHDKFHYLRKHKRYKKGIRFGLAQLKEHRNSAVLHHHIGEFHMELEQYDKAIEHLSKAVRLDPRMEWTRFSLGKCLYLASEYGKAEKALRENIRLTSDRLSHYHSWLFLAMAADARNDQAGCRKALNALKDSKDFIGNEIPLELEFLERLGKKKHLPMWLKKTLQM